MEREAAYNRHVAIAFPLWKKNKSNMVTSTAVQMSSPEDGYIVVGLSESCSKLPLRQGYSPKGQSWPKCFW